MLKDIRKLGQDLKNYFSEMKDWNEITFNEEDRKVLLNIENVAEVYKHSLKIKKSSTVNHIIIPSQYILYAVFVKNFASALRNHIEVFASLRKGKTNNEIGREINTDNYDLNSLNLDPWSKKIALKPIIDDEYNFNAKSLINGERGNYTIRSYSDFFGSVMIKIINVPQASSSILGDIIYELTGNEELYNYLEKRFYKYFPFIIKENKSKRFAYKVFYYLFQYDGLSKLKDCIQDNRDENFKSIKAGDISLTSIFKVSENLQSEENLTSGDKQRFFTEPIDYSLYSRFLYFSTEWTSGTDSRLDIDSLSKILEKYYPEFSISQNENYFIFKAEDAPLTNLTGYNKTFELDSIISSIDSSGLQYTSEFITRFTASLLTKPFVILTGLSGSGKTKLAQAFVQWICLDKSQYRVVPVGSDWTNREPLLGYPNALDSEEYVKPDSGVLELIIHAAENPDFAHFLILDEMNLSRVERYFADFLSAMESDEKIPLYSGNERNGVPKSLTLPSNLFVIGTVNVDETTSMFSPKVLDRANTIEFRVTKDEMKAFLGDIKEIDMKMLNAAGAGMAKSFLDMARDNSFNESEEVQTTLIEFFEELKKAGAEFGYRSAAEILKLIHKLSELNDEFSTDEKVDIVIMQKLLPKLHGSRRKLCPRLETLAKFCILKEDDNREDIVSKVFEKDDYDYNNSKYPLSLEKISRMYNGAVDHGFASFAEA